MTDRKSGGEPQDEERKGAVPHPELERLCADARPLALRMAMRLVPPAHAEDIVQGVLMQLSKQWSAGPDGFSPPRSLNGAISDVLWKHVADFMEQRAARDARDTAYEAEQASITPTCMDPAMALEQSEIDQALGFAYHALPTKKRDAHIMVREEEMTYDAVGKAMGVNERTARRWVQEAQDFLADQLKPFWYQGFGPGESDEGE
jgi:RNA polymerase sigma factor (sigma-70 family)